MQLSNAGSRGISDAVGRLLPAVPGAYVLLLELHAAVACAVAGQHCRIPAGTYGYCGNARGPGGIRARGLRHLTATGRPRWHIDQLAPHAARRGLLTVPGGDQCDLVETLLAAGGRVAAPGFGSTDCRRCRSHLVALAAGSAFAVAIRRLAGIGQCVVVEQDTLGGAVEIVELPGAQRPHEGEQPEEPEGQRDGHEIDEHVQGSGSAGGWKGSAAAG